LHRIPEPAEDIDVVPAFLGIAAFSSIAGQLRYDVNGQDLIVSGDLNGDGTADFSFKVANLASLLAADFVL